MWCILSFMSVQKTHYAKRMDHKVLWIWNIFLFACLSSLSVFKYMRELHANVFLCSSEHSAVILREAQVSCIAVLSLCCWPRKDKETVMGYPANAAGVFTLQTDSTRQKHGIWSSTLRTLCCCSRLNEPKWTVLLFWETTFFQLLLSRPHHTNKNCLSYHIWKCFEKCTPSPKYVQLKTAAEQMGSEVCARPTWPAVEGR